MPEPGGSAARPWLLLALGLLGILLGVGVVLLLAARELPVVQEAVEVVAPQRTRPPARVVNRPARTRVAAEGVRIRFVDRAGSALPGLHGRFRACQQEGEPEPPWRELVADDAGEATVAPCGLVESLDPEWRVLGSPFIDDERLDDPVLVLLTRVCPGAVEVTRGGDPVEGMVVLFPGGRAPLDTAGRAELDRRPCGSVEVTVSATDAGITTAPETVLIEGLETVTIELDDLERRPRKEARTVQVTLQCDSCPDKLRTTGLHTECDGSGQDWRCPCWTNSACSITGMWQEVIFDWRYTKEEIARVPTEVDAVIVPLDGDVSELTAEWAGPLPCVASAVHQQTGAHAPGRCEPDGAVWFVNLRPGPWTVRVGWGPGSDLSSPAWAQVRQTVVMDGEDVDLGVLAP